MLMQLIFGLVGVGFQQNGNNKFQDKIIMIKNKKMHFRFHVIKANEQEHIIRITCPWVFLVANESS